MLRGSLWDRGVFGIMLELSHVTRARKFQEGGAIERSFGSHENGKKLAEDCDAQHAVFMCSS